MFLTRHRSGRWVIYPMVVGTLLMGDTSPWLSTHLKKRPLISSVGRVTHNALRLLYGCIRSNKYVQVYACVYFCLGLLYLLLYVSDATGSNGWQYIAVRKASHAGAGATDEYFFLRFSVRWALWRKSIVCAANVRYSISHHPPLLHSSKSITAKSLPSLKHITSLQKKVC